MAKGRKWNKDDLNNAVKNSYSIREVIIELGLVPAGGNYEQIKKAISSEGLSTKHFTGQGWRRNKTFDYNLHFHFGIKNQTNAKINIKIFIKCKSEEELRDNLTRIWISDSIEDEYKIENNIIGKTNFHGKYFFILSLNPYQ